MADQFRIQYAFGCAIFAIIFAVFQKRIPAMVYLLFVVPNLAKLIPFYMSDQNAVPSPHNTSYSALLINVNTESGDPDLVVELVNQTSPDFVVFEEVNDRWMDQLESLHRHYPYRIALPREDNFGIALFSKFEPTLKKIISIGISEAPSVVASYEINKKAITILGTHPVPLYGGQYSAWRNAQLSGISNALQHYSPPYLVLGDLNVTPWSYHFKQLLKTADLKDSLKGRGLQPSWPTCLPILWIPIDHCLFSSGIEIVKRQLQNNVGSDHYSLLVNFLLTRDHFTDDRTMI